MFRALYAHHQVIELSKIKLRNVRYVDISQYVHYSYIQSHTQYQQMHITGLKTAHMFYKTATCFGAETCRSSFFKLHIQFATLLCAFVGIMTHV